MARSDHKSLCVGEEMTDLAALCESTNQRLVDLPESLPSCAGLGTSTVGTVGSD